MPTPKKIDLTYEQVKALKQGIIESNLDESYKELLQGVIDFCVWLQLLVLEKRISISRLKSMIFGEPKPKNKSSTSSPKPKQNQSRDVEAKNDEQQWTLENTANDNKQLKKSGRLSHQQYLNKEKIEVKHQQYSAGQPCPLECGGKLWNVTPGNVIKITGQGFAKTTHYEIEKLRCSLCGFYTVADLPENVSDEKYDAAFKAQLCMLKYYLGMPFYRIESYQTLLGIPLPDSTQWDLVEQVANCAYPIFSYLEYLAAQGRLVHIDDTNVRILSKIKEARADNPGRRGTFTTGVISYYQGHQIHLCYSSPKHAGENMTALLKKRHSDLPPIHYMCDALSRNVPKEHDVVLMNCLAHARRKFVEVQPFFTEECTFVINQIAIVYHNDAYAKRMSMCDAERMIYHQEHSKPIMKQLKAWLETQFEENLVEENNSLGKAIRYMLKHWGPLTQFLRLEGAPLDNNILEASLKVPIRIRKNAMFYKTEHGAFIGSMMLSLIQTCQANEINPVEYLTILQANKSQVFKEPLQATDWLEILTKAQLLQY